jgi:hypothetical protein
MNKAIVHMPIDSWYTNDPKHKLTIQEKLKLSVSLIYDKLKEKQHSLKEV